MSASKRQVKTLPTQDGVSVQLPPRLSFSSKTSLHSHHYAWYLEGQTTSFTQVCASVAVHSIGQQS
jgi:hypothetical protein